ncbi:hypothetical protein ACFL2X_01340 [Candidatus Latescibacterota bacterium]
MKQFICPKCKYEFSLIERAKALTIGQIKCPKCKSILKLGKDAGIAYS